MVTIEKAKELLGDTAKKMSDDEILKTVDTLYKLAHIVINNYLAMTPEQRKAIEDKYDNEHPKTP